MTDLGFIDWCVCIAYLAVVFGLAFKSARGQQDNEDYFIGGRSMNWCVVGVSMFATSFSAISFLGLPQRGAYQDFSFYLTILFIPFVITPILWWIFVPMFVRLKVSSGYEYLGRRFGLPAQLIGSGLYCIYALGWMGTMLYAVALTLQTVMGLTHAQYYFVLVGIGAFATLYTVMGGLKAVIWTDVLQAVVLGGAIIAVMFLAVSRIDGGWSNFWSIAAQHSKFKMFHLNPRLLSVENFTGRNTLFTAAAFGLFMYLPGYAVSQNMIQRYVCAGTLAGGRGVVILSAVINAVLGLLFLLVGTAIFAFYSQPGGLGLPTAGIEFAKEDQTALESQPNPHHPAGRGRYWGGNPCPLHWRYGDRYHHGHCRNLSGHTAGPLPIGDVYAQRESAGSSDWRCGRTCVFSVCSAPYGYPQMVVRRLRHVPDLSRRRHRQPMFPKTL